MGLMVVRSVHLCMPMHMLLCMCVHIDSYVRVGAADVSLIAYNVYTRMCSLLVMLCIYNRKVR